MKQSCKKMNQKRNFNVANVIFPVEQSRYWPFMSNEFMKIPMTMLNRSTVTWHFSKRI